MSEKIPVKNVTPPGQVQSYDLYAKRDKIHTRSYQGFFRNVRLIGVGLLFLLYFGTAWLDWGGRQICRHASSIFSVPLSSRKTSFCCPSC